MLSQNKPQSVPLKTSQKRHKTDVPFVALALSVANDGVWSNDKHFENLRGVKVWKTSGLLKFIEKKSIDRKKF